MTGIASTVHHTLLQCGEMSAEKLARHLDMPLADTYAELARLDALDAVSMRGYRKRFWSAYPLPSRPPERAQRRPA